MNFKRFISVLDMGNREVYLNINCISDFGPDFTRVDHTYVVLVDGRSLSLQININDFCKTIGVEACQNENEKKQMKSKHSRKK